MNSIGMSECPGEFRREQIKEASRIRKERENERELVKNQMETPLNVNVPLAGSLLGS
jgi:hypothetical protein